MSSKAKPKKKKVGVSGDDDGECASPTLFPKATLFLPNPASVRNEAASAAKSAAEPSTSVGWSPMTLDKLVSRFPKTIGRENMAFVSLANMQRAGASCGDLVFLRPVRPFRSGVHHIAMSSVSTNLCSGSRSF